YIIVIANTFSKTLKTNPTSGLPSTTKSEEGHGFGLAGIRHVARKYLGDIEIRKEIFEGEEQCVLRVMLQIPKT
ncbi:MAG: GHKL domain-containing protein, partial [Lachnospiraceae bacterium]|nr:GHKL domain-containing protein [Lachnospiraceae bacterium]